MLFSILFLFFSLLVSVGCRAFTKRNKLHLVVRRAVDQIRTQQQHISTRAIHRFHGLHGVFNVWCAMSTVDQTPHGAWHSQVRKAAGDLPEQRACNDHTIFPVRISLASNFLPTVTADNSNRCVAIASPQRWAIKDHIHAITWQVLII